ncbi:MAG TPA: molybdopterin converting factor subunit 1 [Vitreimonas sp.]|uniref:molybdopterin converting factor subunit 1 n=1 Tax=Vitreimonas sp. TaxID=3069702 RepID=UPI002D3A03A8|nr:molybdopterin converting factor subunit 1 [Vitreimonas sp.]HYD89298.1 molybdopterin converting factor subunit 1 [Vitreimonas sp.]
MTRILFFGSLRDRAGCAQMEIDLPAHVDTLQALRVWLTDRNPDLGEALEARSIRVAVDHAFVSHDAPIRAGAEIAFMSPLSGG